MKKTHEHSGHVCTGDMSNGARAARLRKFEELNAHWNTDAGGDILSHGAPSAGKASMEKKKVASEVHGGSKSRSGY